MRVVYNVTGIIDYSWSAYKILPRDANDIDNISSIANNTNNLITIYPNPTSDYISINSIDNNTKFTLIDSTGKIFISKTLNSSKSIIDISHISDGTYFCIVDNFTTKLIIKK